MRVKNTPKRSYKKINEIRRMKEIATRKEFESIGLNNGRIECKSLKKPPPGGRRRREAGGGGRQEAANLHVFALFQNVCEYLGLEEPVRGRRSRKQREGRREGGHGASGGDGS